MLVNQQQHVVVGLPPTTCWYTNNNMLLLVYLQQHMLVNQQQHVVLEVYRHTQHKIPPENQRECEGSACQHNIHTLRL